MRYRIRNIAIGAVIAALIGTAIIASEGGGRKSLTKIAIAAVDAVIESLRSNPEQTIGTMRVGVYGVGGPGGPGVVGNAEGGSGSGTTIGVLGSAGDASVSNAQRGDDAAKNAQEAIVLLQEIRAELRNQKRESEQTILSRLDSLSKTYLAPATGAVLGAVLKEALGLSAAGD